MLDKWRARIGWIHPRVNSDIEIYGFYQAAPKNVVLVVTHLEVVDSARKDEVEASLKFDQLEQKIGKPVVSSNSANIWGSLNPLGIKVGPGFGRLLSSL
jgi:maleate cis-trans isomerase